MRFSDIRKYFKKKKAGNTANKKGSKSSPSPPIIGETQQRPPKKGERHDKENVFSTPENQITVVCPEKKERIFSPANILTFTAVIVSGLAVYFASESNRQVAKQFELENRPYIILSDAKPGILRPDSNLSIDCWIKNVGKTPALLLDGAQTGIGTYNSENPDKLIYDGKIRRANRFLESGDTLMFYFGGILPEKPKMYNLIMQGKLFPLAYGQIFFKDIVSNKKYSYTFCVRILENGRYIGTELNNRFVEID